MPELRERLLEERIRRAWSAIVGTDTARRAHPIRFANACLEVVVDTSPWLHELTLRSPDLTARLAAHFPEIRALRFVQGALPAESAAPRTGDPRPTPVGGAAAREIDDAVPAIADEDLQRAARRLMTKARRSPVVRVLGTLVRAGALASGCAIRGRGTAEADGTPPRRTVVTQPSMTAEAYYHYSVVQLYTQAGRFKDAVAALEEAIKRDSSSAFLWRELAQWLARADAPEQAVAAARRAVALEPKDPTSHLTLADLLRQQKKYADAESELEKVIGLNPTAEEPYLTLARFHVEQKAYDRARAVLLRLAERQPRLAQAQFLLGRLAIETENLDEAIARLTHAVDLDPDHDGAWTALGFAYEAKHQPEQAVEIYRRAITANPDNPAFVERLSDLLIRLGRFKEAQAEIETLTENAPRDARLWMKLGAVYYEQKIWDKASEAFRRAVLLEPNNLRARYFLATSLMDGGRDDDARAELERILRLDPRSIDARVQLGFLHGRAKHHDQAGGGRAGA